MEKQFDAQALMERVTLVAKELRKSDMYPAIVGGVAGGIAGTLMAIIIAGRKPAARSAGANEETATRSASGLPIRELMQLIPVVMSLIKQVQAWAQKETDK